MSKESALAMAGATTPANPSLLAPQTTPVSTETTTPVAPTIDSDRFSHLAAKEAQLVKQRELLKSDQQKAYEEKEKLRSVKAQIDKFQALQKQDPVAALKEIGFKEEDILNFLADKQPEELTPEQKASQAAQLEVQKLRDEMKAKDDQLLKERDEKNIQGFKNNLGDKIKKEAEKFKFLNHAKEIGQDLVYETVLAIMKDDKEVSPYDAMNEALELVEKNYNDEYVEMTKFMTHKELDAHIEAAPLPPERRRVVQPPVMPVDKAVQKPAPTLTPKATATIASTVPKPETKAQKRERLENMLRSGLAKR